MWRLKESTWDGSAYRLVWRANFKDFEGFCNVNEYDLSFRLVHQEMGLKLKK